MDMGEGNYVELVEGGLPPDQRTGYDTFNHLGLRTPNTDASYARAIAASAKPFTVTVKGQVWDGTPADFILNGENGEKPIRLRLAYLMGTDGPVIEFVQGDEL